MSSNSINFHFGEKPDVAAHDAFIGRAYKQVFQNLENDGYGATITRGSGHFDLEAGTVNEIWIPENDGIFKTRKDVGERAIAGVIDATRDITRNLAPSREYPMPLLNARPIIELDNSKFRAHKEVLTTLSAPTVLLDAGSLEALDDLVGDQLFIKPDRGSGGAGIEIVSRKDIHELLSRRSSDRLIAQEVITMASELPGLRPLNETEAAKMSTLKDRKKEVRLFVFRGDHGVETLGVARFMKDGEEESDTWVHIDQASIPHEIVSIAKTAFDNLAERGKVSEVYGAADFMYGSVPSSPEDHWLIGELNLWRPVLNRKGNKEIGIQHDKALASQLVRLAKAGATNMAGEI